MKRNEWMQGEIESWRAEGVIDGATAETLRARYSLPSTRLSFLTLVLSMFGALMTGLGVIALLAVNWDSFGRPLRAAIAIAPVVLCGVAAFLGARRGVKNAGFWEAVGVLWCLSAGAAICLVAQTYHVGGTVPGFILLLAIVTLPVVWLTRAVMPMAVWPVMAVVWTLVSSDWHGPANLPLLAKGTLFLSASLPAYVAFVRRGREGPVFMLGQIVTGHVYLAALFVLFRVAGWRMPTLEAFVLQCWAAAAVFLVPSCCFRLPAWPAIATLVASYGAFFTLFSEAVLLYFLSFGIAVAILAAGIALMRRIYLNVGVGLLFCLVFGKFLASDVSFMVKGLTLVVAGAAVTTFNVALSKFFKKRRACA